MNGLAAKAQKIVRAQGMCSKKMHKIAMFFDVKSTWFVFVFDLVDEADDADDADGDQLASDEIALSSRTPLVE